MLSASTEVLEREGFQVRGAANACDARKILEQGDVNLAVIDVCLEDHDASGRDESGLELARSADPLMPKIFVTGYYNWAVDRAVHQQDRSGLPLGIGIVDRREGPGALINAVRVALKPRSVFVVHGHDELAKEQVARCIRDNGLYPIVLHEQPNSGQTIMEKIERYSTVGFTVVILTPDDVGGAAGNGMPSESRARENVIFELGYFSAKLGRQRVCVLRKGDPGIFSDFQGILYVPMDGNGAWKSKLSQEREAAGLNINRRGIV
jgi:predicted nucleotide-binding protein